MTGKAKTRRRKIGLDGGQRTSKRRLSVVSSVTEILTETGHDTVALAAILSLASRGLLPEPVKESLEGKLIRVLATKLFGIVNVHIDSSNFAKHLTSCAKLTTHSNLTEEERLADWLVEQLRDDCGDNFSREQISDPLFVGWIYQCLILRRNNYAHLRNERSLHRLSQITQWFTPEWVSEFLLEECFPASEADSGDTVTFLDSSCGAGHILVPALRKLIARQQRNGATVDCAINHVLEHELFGLDIDPLMMRLSGVAIYLTCRDLAADAPFPIPQLFTFENGGTSSAAPISEPACHGSLLLSLKPRPDIPLYRVDGFTVRAADLPNHFNAQALNPPYLSHRLMPKTLSKFLQDEYESSHYDLYAAFLELGIRLMTDNGRLALICQQSFLTTSRYEELRKQLVRRCHVNSIVQLGPGSFDSRAGEKVNNAIITLSRRKSSDDDNAHEIRTYNMISNASKRAAEREGISNFEKRIVSEKSFLATSRTIPGFPLAVHCPEEVARLFERLPSMAQSDCGITLTNGLFTCDNKRFVRHFKEVNGKFETDRPFVPYDKGGGQKWFSTTPYLLEWIDDGNELREFRASRGQSRALPGERFYFQKGITYSYIGTKGFKARLLSPGSVFDIASSALFAERLDLNYMLGFLNSALVRFILGTLNPTVNFQIGDLRRIPMRKPTPEIEERIASLTKEAIRLAREADRLNAASPAFAGALLQLFSTVTREDNSRFETCSKETASNAKGAQHQSAYENLVAHFQSINEREASIQAAIDEEIFNLYKISGTTRDIVKENEWVARTDDPLVQIPSLQKCLIELKSETKV